MQLVFGLDQQIADYVAHHFPIVIQRGGYEPDLAIGIANQNILKGGIILTDYIGHDGEITLYLAPKTTLSRKLLKQLFAFAFFQLKLRRITAKIAKKNKASRHLVERLGFTLEGVMKKGFHNGDDLCLYGMLASHCPWIQRKGKKIKEKRKENENTQSTQSSRPLPTGSRTIRCKS